MRVVWGIAAALLLALGAARSTPAAAPSLLGGRLDVDSFVVPKGARVVVDRDLVVRARHEIEIAGTLLLAPGVGLDLRAGTTFVLTRSGRVVPLPARAMLAAKLQPTPKPHLRGKNLEFGGSDRVEIHGQVLAPPGISVKVATAEFGDAFVDGDISAGRGRDSANPAFDGEDGGNITVGGYFGRNQLVTIASGAVLFAGGGGDGYDARAGTAVLRRANPCQDHGGSEDARNVWTYQASDGGAGGAIRLWGDLVSVDTNNVEPGRGGLGGDVGGRRERAPNGKKGHAGADVVAHPGWGGRGGGFLLDAKDVLGKGVLRAASGGGAGDVTIAAGDGAPGCDGGRTTIVVGRPGLNGATKGRSAYPAAASGRPAAVVLEKGALGGRGQDSDHSAGDGGRVTVTVAGLKKKRRKEEVVPPIGLVRSIEFRVYANGGYGYHGCGGKQQERGTDGGAGGTLEINAPYEAAVAFLGRNGGDGSPPGQGGRAGRANRPPAQELSSFKSGTDGAPCSPGETPPPPGTHRYQVVIVAHGTVSLTAPTDTLSAMSSSSSWRGAWTVDIKDDVVNQQASTVGSTLLSLTGSANASYTSTDGQTCAQALTPDQVVGPTVKLVGSGLDQGLLPQYHFSKRFGFALTIPEPDRPPWTSATGICSGPGFTDDAFLGLDNCEYVLENQATKRFPLNFPIADLGEKSFTRSIDLPYRNGSCVITPLHTPYAGSVHFELTVSRLA